MWNELIRSRCGQCDEDRSAHISLLDIIGCTVVENEFQHLQDKLRVVCVRIMFDDGSDKLRNSRTDRFFFFVDQGIEHTMFDPEIFEIITFYRMAIYLSIIYIFKRQLTSLDAAIEPVASYLVYKFYYFTYKSVVNILHSRMEKSRCKLMGTRYTTEENLRNFLRRLVSRMAAYWRCWAIWELTTTSQRAAIASGFLNASFKSAVACRIQFFTRWTILLYTKVTLVGAICNTMLHCVFLRHAITYFIWASCIISQDHTAYTWWLLCIWQNTWNKH